MARQKKVTLHWAAGNPCAFEHRCRDARDACGATSGEDKNYWTGHYRLWQIHMILPVPSNEHACRNCLRIALKKGTNYHSANPQERLTDAQIAAIKSILGKEQE